jgi:hypothetical protein
MMLATLMLKPSALCLNTQPDCCLQSIRISTLTWQLQYISMSKTTSILVRIAIVILITIAFIWLLLLLHF